MRRVFELERYLVVKEMQMPFGLLIRFVDFIQVNFNSTIMLMVHWYRYRYQAIKRSTFKFSFLCSVGVCYLKRQMPLGYQKIR